MVRIDFWRNPMVLEEMTPEDKLFYIYLLTNSNTTQVGIYKMTKKEMAFDLGYSIESVHSLMERFIEVYKLIRYNPATREMAIRNWGKFNLHKAGKPVMDCIFSELKEVEDSSLIHYVSESIQKQEIRSLYESFCRQEEILRDIEDSDLEENDTYIEPEWDELDEVIPACDSLGGKCDNQQQEAIDPDKEIYPDRENPLQENQTDVKEIIEFWDANGFGFTNVNAKQQLLSWLEDSSFLQPKAMILKAMNIACANNKRRLNYVVGILKNWENESLLTVEEIDSNQENKLVKQRQTLLSVSAGRDIPKNFVLDLTDGEES
jgi:DnaD/phage-associated family protein